MRARLGSLWPQRPASGPGAEAMAASTFDAKLLDGVAAFVETNRFLAHLEEFQGAGGGDAGAGASAAAAPPHVTLAEKRHAATSPTSAEARRSAEHAAQAAASATSSPAIATKTDDDDPMTSSGVYVVAPAADGGFVVVSREDAVEALAYFIAGWLAKSSPEARGMDPKQLQKALGQTMTSLRRARWRAVLGWGRVGVAALSYGASVVLAGGQPPALYRAVVAALWAAARMAYRAVG
jgi:hypothetical protein